MELELPNDFKEFLSLFRKHGVRYLLIGGFAVVYYGYVRATDDLDIWIARSQENADRVAAAMREFGFDLPNLSSNLFLQDRHMVRIGRAPIRIEITTSISGVDFEECYAERSIEILDGLEVNLISLEKLKINKEASGRLKDRADLEKLEKIRESDFS